MPWVSCPSRSPSTRTSATVRARSRASPARSRSADAKSTSTSARYLFNKISEFSAPGFGKGGAVRELPHDVDVRRASAAVRRGVDGVHGQMRVRTLDDRQHIAAFHVAGLDH